MRMRTSLLVTLLLLSACGSTPVIVASPSACSQVLPDSWEKGVDHASTPDPAPPKPADQAGIIAWTLDELKKWTGFAIAEAAVVDQANGRTADTIGIVKRCEVRDGKAVKAARPKVLGIF